MATLVYTVDAFALDKLDFERVKPQAQKFFSDRLLAESDPYTPYDLGILKSSGRVVDDGNAIEYETPYARYQYYGKLMVDPITGKGAFFNKDYGFWSRPMAQKKLTDRDLKYQGAPTRGSHWVERAWLANKDSLIEQTEDYITSEMTK